MQTFISCKIKEILFATHKNLIRTVERNDNKVEVQLEVHLFVWCVHAPMLSEKLLWFLDALDSKAFRDTMLNDKSKYVLG
ncbi:hypothetical protein Naga_100281g9 [Nannochloropsis gaditana]|uniref:Uncharacterized protein n=1 Tax=Nannochloropsis gaditana TaxID=72520 RepID=W7TXD3_9STRA|nr:hypothetical protein Naga_100281g9 [Nannochloropsis gaditana]